MTWFDGSWEVKEADVGPAGKYGDVVKPALDLLSKYKVEAKTVYDLLKHLSQAEGEIDALQKDKKALQDQLSVASKTIDQLKKEKAAEDQQLANAKAEIDQLKKDKASEEQQLAHSKEQVDHLKSDLAAAEQTLVGLMPFINQGTSNGVIRIYGVSWGPKEITDPVVYQRLLDHAKARTQFHVTDEFMIHDTLVGQHKSLTVAWSQAEKGPVRFMVADGNTYGHFDY